MNYTQMVNKRNWSAVRCFGYGLCVPISIKLGIMGVLGSFIAGIGLAIGGVGSSDDTKKTERNINFITIGGCILSVGASGLLTYFSAKKCFKNGQQFLKYRTGINNMISRNLRN